MPRQFTIRLGDQNWRVRFVNKRPIVDGEQVDGYCQHGHRLIVIYSKLNERDMRSCFLDEALHGLLWHIDNDVVDVYSEQLNDALEKFESITEG